MKVILAFFQLIRVNNLIFIAITQLLINACIIEPLLLNAFITPTLQHSNLWLIIVASVCIAAAGNVINDYFDVNIDLINKPQKLIVNKIISRRWVIFWHLFLSLAGIICTFYVAYQTKLIWLVFANASCVLLLFVYSASLKKKLLLGNVLVSALTAWVILILVFPGYKIFANYTIAQQAASDKMLRLGILYAAFSFIISLIREVVKDMEDIEGDAKNGCKTMPIVWGINATKVFVAVWLLVLISILVIIQVYVLRFNWWLSIIYCILTIIAPLLWVLKLLFKANDTIDFTKISSLIKWIILAGITSMIFVKWYQ